MLPWDVELAGRLDRKTITSDLLRDNPLGDPHERPLWVYVPPGYDLDTAARYPAVYVIQGYTGSVSMWANRTPFRQPFIETADAAFAGGVPGCVVVYVDAWTALGGSQFVDSPGTGQYHSYLCDEVVPWVDEHYRTIPDRDSRAVAGKSSGGFGAMITPMLRPDVFGALATHAGDTLYELSYIPDFAKAARALRDYDHDIDEWHADFKSRPAFTKPEDGVLIEMMCLSSCFSPDADGKPILPFDPATGVLRQEQWARWLAWDPVRMVPGHADALRSLHSIWIDAGTSDEWYLDLGAQAFRAELAKIGVADGNVRFELFAAGHAAIDYRYPMSLAWLAERLRRTG
ncbi:MAG TPA: alpha/beta hydrolase-fold protein [Actinokineospora sp.]|jgi:S-formylglutathione hydrolase FrmB|nr:alpha/beta hydrolase-fold protein [Actinokineospora sp.]